MKKMYVVLTVLALVCGFTATDTKAQTVVEWLTLSIILPGISSGNFAPSTGLLNSFFNPTEARNAMTSVPEGQTSVSSMPSVCAREEIGYRSSENPTCGTSPTNTPRGKPPVRRF